MPPKRNKKIVKLVQVKSQPKYKKKSNGSKRGPRKFTSSAMDSNVVKRFSMRSVPSSVSNSYNPRTKITRMGAAAKADTGEPGERFAFNLEWISIASSASNGYMLNANAGYVFDPFAIGGRTLVEASLFTKYCIRSLSITYINIIGTAVAGNMVISICEDPLSQSLALPSPVTAKSISEFRHSREIPLNLPTQNCINYKYDGRLLYYVDPASSEDSRFTAQLAIFGVGNGVAASSTYGKLQIRGIIDYYAPNNVASPPSMQGESLQRWIDMRSGKQRLMSILELRERSSPTLRLQSLEEKFESFVQKYGKCFSRLGDSPVAPTDVNVVGGNVTISPGTSALLVTAGTTALLTALSGTPTVSLSSGLFPLPITIDSKSGPSVVTVNSVNGSSGSLGTSVTGSVTNQMYGLSGTTSVPISCDSAGNISANAMAFNGTSSMQLHCGSSGVIGTQLYGANYTNSALTNIVVNSNGKLLSTICANDAFITADTNGVLNTKLFGSNSTDSSLTNLVCNASGQIITVGSSGSLVAAQAYADCGTSGMLPITGMATGTSSCLIESHAYAVNFSTGSFNEIQCLVSGSEHLVRAETTTEAKLPLKEVREPLESDRLKKLLRLKQLSTELGLDDAVMIINEAKEDKKYFK